MYTCVYTCMHVKYTCQPTLNSLYELGIPKNPSFDPSHVSVAVVLIFEGKVCLWPLTSHQKFHQINHIGGVVKSSQRAESKTVSEIQTQQRFY